MHFVLILITAAYVINQYRRPSTSRFYRLAIGKEGYNFCCVDNLGTKTRPLVPVILKKTKWLKDLISL